MVGETGFEPDRRVSDNHAMVHAFSLFHVSERSVPGSVLCPRMPQLTPPLPPRLGDIQETLTTSQGAGSQVLVRRETIETRWSVALGPALLLLAAREEDGERTEGTARSTARGSHGPPGLGARARSLASLPQRQEFRAASGSPTRPRHVD